LKEGYTIKKGTVIFIRFPIMHYSPKYWTDAEVFNPDRWDLLEAQENFRNGTFIPFSTGPRKCIGHNFGLFEAKLAFVALLKTFDIELGDSYIDGDRFTISNAPINGLPVKLRTRRD
jgi:cytochrome P450/NADPH-cytochrome P450 reductase